MDSMAKENMSSCFLSLPLYIIALVYVPIVSFDILFTFAFRYLSIYICFDLKVSTVIMLTWLLAVTQSYCIRFAHPWFNIKEWK